MQSYLYDDACLAGNVLRKIIISSIFLNLALLLGRLSGFARELIVAHTYGVSTAADIVVLWLTLPDLLLSILAGSAVGAALIPQFIAASNRAKAVWLQAIVAFFLIFIIFAIILQYFSGYLIRLLAPGLPSEVFELANIGVKVGIFLFPLSLLAAVNSAYFHYKEQFFLPGLGTLVFNIVLIVGLIFFNYYEFSQLYWVLIALACAVFIRFAYQFAFIFDRSAWHGLIGKFYLKRTVFTKFFSAMISSSLLFVYPVVGRAFSSASAEGGVASFSYTFKLIELPLMLAVTFLSVVFLPSLSKFWLDNKKDFFNLSIRGIEITWLISMFVMLPVFVFNEYYVRLVFGKVLDQHVLGIMSDSIKVGAFVLLSQGNLLFVSTVFNSAGLTHIPLISNIFGILLYSLLLNFMDVDGLAMIVALLVVSQTVTGALMFIFMRFFWWSQIKEFVSYKWFFSILLVGSFLVIFDMLQIQNSLFLKLSVFIPAYALFVVLATLGHPLLFARIKNVACKLKRN